MKKKIIKIALFLVVAIFLGISSAIGYITYDYSSKNYNEYTINLKAGNIIDEIRINNSKKNLKLFENENLKTFKENEESEENQLLKMLVLNDETLNIKLFSSESISVTFENCDNTTFIINNEDKTELIKDNYLAYKDSSFKFLKEMNSNKIAMYMLAFIIIDSIFLYLIIKFYEYMRSDGNETRFIIIHSLAYAISLFVIMLFSYYVLYDLLKYFVIIPVALFIIFNILMFKGKNYEKLYLACAITFGVLMIFIMAPSNVPDEASHYIKGYELSGIYGEEGNGFIQLPSVTNDFLSINGNVQEYDNKISARYYFKELFKSSDYSELMDGMAYYVNVKKAFFVPYILLTICVKIGVSLSLSPLMIFLISRLLNLLFASFITYFAIKIAPRFKKILFIIALLPIVIQQSGALNVDSYTNAVGFLLLAYLLKLIYEINEIRVKEIVLLFLSGLLLCFGKFGYFPIALMLILVKNEKFKSKNIGIIIKVLFFVFMLFGSFFFNTINNFLIPGIMNDKENVYGLKYILTNPLSAIAIYGRSLLIRHDQDIFRGFFNCYGYSTITLQSIPYLVSFVMYVIILFTKEADNQEKRLNNIERVVYLGIFAMLIAIIYTIAFASWTIVGGRSILGVQARYFIPLLPLLYFVIQDIGININLSDSTKEKLKNRDIYFILMSITYIIAYFTIICFFA